MSDAPWSSSHDDCALQAALVAAMRADLPPQGSRERTVARLTGWAPLIAIVLWTKRTQACHAQWLQAGVGALVVSGALAVVVAVQQPSAQNQVKPPPGSVERVQIRTHHEPPAPSARGLAAASPGRLAPSTTLSAGTHRAGDATEHSVSNPDSSAASEPRVASASTVTSTEATGAATSRLASPARQARVPSSSEVLEAEVAALYGVRSVLAAGLPSVAIERLADYERAFPRGALRTEARVLRVSALLQNGERDRAEALGQAMLRADPNGTHAGRLRALLDRRER